MTKLINYLLVGDNIKKDAAWRNTYLCNIDKEYSILSIRHSTTKIFSRLEIVVSDDTAIVMKLRNSYVRVTEYDSSTEK